MERELLEIFVEWNPLGVPDFCIHDEYSYLIDGLFDNCNDIEELYMHLMKILKEDMGLDISKCHEEEIYDVATKMYNLINA